MKKKPIKKAVSSNKQRTIREANLQLKKDLLKSLLSALHYSDKTKEKELNSLLSLSISNPNLYILSLKKESKANLSESERDASQKKQLNFSPSIKEIESKEDFDLSKVSLRNYISNKPKTSITIIHKDYEHLKEDPINLAIGLINKL